MYLLDSLNRIPENIYNWRYGLGVMANTYRGRAPPNKLIINDIIL